MVLKSARDFGDMEKNVNDQKRLYIVAGSNGAGKSTAVDKVAKYIPNLKKIYVNPDAIQQDSGCGPRVAGHKTIKKVEELMSQGKPNVMCETTLAGNIPHLNLAHKYGYKIILIFIMLDSVAQGKERVSKRKDEGGHFVERETQERHFFYSLLNIGTVPFECDEWRIYSNVNGGYKPVAKGQGGRIDKICDQPKFEKLASMRKDVLQNHLPDLFKAKSVQKRWLTSPSIFASTYSNVH